MRGEEDGVGSTVCGKPVRIRREPVAVTGDGLRTKPLVGRSSATLERR
jgi:hypothetical protein